MPDLDKLPGSVNMTFIDSLERECFDPTLPHVLLSYVQPVKPSPPQASYLVPVIRSNCFDCSETIGLDQYQTTHITHQDECNGC